MNLNLNLVLCPYCNKRSEEVTGKEIYPHRKDLYSLKFYRCLPCDAYVGCHKDTGKPLGRLADESLRDMKQNTHAHFDDLWKAGRFSRGGAYKWLARKLKLSKDECHIGEFDIKTCAKVIALCIERRRDDQTR